VHDKVALVDYGAGNLKSVENALFAAGATQVLVTSDPETVASADRILLPGVGAFGACMNALSGIDGMVEALEQAVLKNARPFLGICVGMQLMADHGEELGSHKGLGWIDGVVKLIEPTDPTVKVPHMGWNDVVPTTPHPLIVPGEAYFLHSFAVTGVPDQHVLATTNHGGSIIAAIGRDNMIGAQFHPEKSQAYGLAFLKRFLEWQP